MIDIGDRTTYLGGSDIAAILGLSKWRSPLDVYLEKTGQVQPQGEPGPDNEKYWGKMHEDRILDAYETMTGCSSLVRNPPMMTHRKYPFLCAHIDALWAWADRVVEAKISRVRGDWGEPGTDAIPDYYKTQTQDYMTICAMPVADVAVLFNGSEFCIYTIEDDPALAEIIIESAAQFWTGNVIPRIPPPPRSMADLAALFPRSISRQALATADHVAFLEQIAQLKLQADEIEEKIETLGVIVRNHMGDADELLYGGKVIATWRSSKDGVKFDMDTFKAENPALYKQYLQAKPGSRRFLSKIK